MIGLLAGVAAYTLAGFLIAPRAIKLWIESPNVSGPDCRLRVQDVYVNPFTMFLSLRNVTLFEQENKRLVSVAGADSQLWSVAGFRAGKPGRDVAIRNLVVTGAGSEEPMLEAPTVAVTDVAVGAGGTFIDAAHARLEQPDAAITRDAAGTRFRSAWSPMSGNDRGPTCISLHSFEVVGGRLRFSDDAVAPGVRLELRDVMTEGQRDPGEDAAVTAIDVDARIGQAGSIRVEMQIRASTEHHPDSFVMTVGNVDLQPLSPYVRRLFGRDLVAGSASGTLRQARTGPTLRIDNDLAIDGLRLGDPDADASAETSSLELALALATDAAGRSRFSVADFYSDSEKRTVAGVFADSLAALLDQRAARPFAVLAVLAGDDAATLDEIAFVPGSAETAPEATDTLTLLARALALRPRLDLRVRPAYDPAADRDAIAAQQVRLHIALATSAGKRERDDPAGPDLDDPRVRDILDEFAGARLSEAQRRAIADDETTMYRDIYLALVANERVSETVLRRLARFRARSVIDALDRQGIDRTRFRIGDALDSVTSDTGTVALKLELETRLQSPD